MAPPKLQIEPFSMTKRDELVNALENQSSRSNYGFEKQSSSRNYGFIKS